MIQKISVLKDWLDKKQRPTLEVAFVSGRLIDWIGSRLIQFGWRRIITLIFFSTRFIFCFDRFKWFSWHDLIFQTSLVYLLVGIHYGSLETFKKTFKGLVTARVITFFISLIILGCFLPELLHRIFYQNYIPNVFDEARFIIVIRGISQIYRNLENAIQIRRGTPPLPLVKLISTEVALLFLFIGMIQFFGATPGILFGVLLVDLLLQEVVLWQWVLSQPYRKKIKWFSLKDFFKKPEISLEFILSCFIGALIYSERFFLQGFVSGLGDNSVYYYFLLLPMVSVTWRLPHLFHRYFRKQYGLLTKQISSSIFKIVFCFLLIIGFLQFLFAFLFFQTNIYFPLILLFLGPTSAILAFSWYKGRSLEFLLILFWMLKLTGLTNSLIPAALSFLWVGNLFYKKMKELKWEKETIKFGKCNSSLIFESVHKEMQSERLSYDAQNLYGKYYLLRSSPEGLLKLKREIFAASLGEVIFNPNLNYNLNLLSEKKNFIPLSSFKMRVLISDFSEGERYLKIIKKALANGAPKKFYLKKGNLLFGINHQGHYGAIFNSQQNAD